MRDLGRRGARGTVVTAPNVGPAAGRREEQRAAVALFHFEEMSVAEVAVALDVPVGTVKTRLMHARRKLRAVLEGDA